jgi:hypothetical protein
LIVGVGEALGEEEGVGIIVGVVVTFNDLTIFFSFFGIV